MAEFCDTAALGDHVPANLLDSFGGPSPSWLEGVARRMLAWQWPLGQFVLLIGLLLLAFTGRRTVVWIKARRRRSGGELRADN